MLNDNDRFSSSTSALLFVAGSAILFLGAIGLFIWLLVGSAENHMLKNVLYGSAFLAITLGLLIYSFLAPKKPKPASIILWAMMALGIATFITGLCIKSPERQVVFDNGIPDMKGMQNDAIPDSLHLIGNE